MGVAAAVAALAAGVGALVLQDGKPGAKREPEVSKLGFAYAPRYYTAAENAAAYQKMKSVGVNLVRFDLYWGQVEPSRGVFDWSEGDRVLAEADREGMEPLVILNGSPPWPFTDADYSNFCERVVERYPTIRFVEVWNEPGLNGISASRYSGLLDACSNGVKSVRPDVVVVGMADFAPWYFDTVLANGPYPNVDKWSVHPYTDPPQRGPHDGEDDQSYYLAKIMRDRAVAAEQAKPVWITEMGWSTAVNCSDSYWCRNGDPVSEEQQADYLAGARDRCFGEWGEWCERFIVYAFKETNPDPTDYYSGFGVIPHDGSEKPAWRALAD